MSSQRAHRGEPHAEPRTSDDRVLAIAVGAVIALNVLMLVVYLIWADRIFT